MCEPLIWILRLIVLIMASHRFPPAGNVVGMELTEDLGRESDMRRSLERGLGLYEQHPRNVVAASRCLYASAINEGVRETTCLGEAKIASHTLAMSTTSPCRIPIDQVRLFHNTSNSHHVNNEINAPMILRDLRCLARGQVIMMRVP